MLEPHYFDLLRSDETRETWCLDQFVLDGGRYVASGWAIPIKGDPARGRILVNGEAPSSAAYGALREDISDIYGYLPNAGLCHFEIAGVIVDKGKDFIEISYVDPTASNFVDEHKNYFIPLSPERFPFPDEVRRHRTTGPAVEGAFAFGGYIRSRKR